MLFRLALVVFIHLILAGSYAQAQPTAVPGASIDLSPYMGIWRGGYYNPEFADVRFTLIFNADRSIQYYDNSDYNPDCKGQITNLTETQVSGDLNCRGCYWGICGDKKITLTIFDYKNLLGSGAHRIHLDTHDYAGEQDIYAQFVPALRFNQPETYRNGRRFYVKPKSIRRENNFQALFYEDGRMFAAPGVVEANGRTYIFGTKQEYKEAGFVFANGAVAPESKNYIIYNEGRYELKDNILTLTVKDDEDKDFVMTVELAPVADQNIFLATFRQNEKEGVTVNVGFADGTRRTALIGATDAGFPNRP